MADDPYAYLSGLSKHPGRPGDTSNFNPTFASALANAIRQARDAGLPVGIGSGFREPKQTGSAYDAGGNSSHTYGLAVDISGLDGPNGKATQQWAQIAAANGLHNPYGIDDTAEFNHWQLPEQPLEQNPQLLASLKAAKATGDMQAVWSAYNAGGGPSRVATGAVADNRQIFYNALTKAGLSPQQALGSLWGLGGESGPTLNTGAYNPKDPGGSVGAGQWLGDRRAALEAYAAKTGKSVTDPQTQADFTVSELTDPKSPTYQPGVFDALKNANTPADATKIWVSQYERPAKDNSAQRIAAGAQVGSLDAKGNFVLGTGGGAAPTAVAPGQPAGGAIGTTLNTLAGAPGQPSPFMQSASKLDKAFGGKGFDQQGQGQGQDQPPPPQILQAQSPRNVSPLLPYASQLYGTTLNSMMTPPSGGSGQPTISVSPYATGATQGGAPVMAGTPVAPGVPQGAVAQQFQQLQQQMQQQALMQQYGAIGGLGGLGGMDSYGGYG